MFIWKGHVNSYPPPSPNYWRFIPPLSFLRWKGGYLFEEEDLKENHPEIIFSTNTDIIFYFQFRRSGVKITLTKKLINCTIGSQTAKCSGLGSCPKNCIMFAIKKPWIDGGYKDGILTDPFIS